MSKLKGENMDNNDGEIRNILNELINNEDETTERILKKKRPVKSKKRMEVNPIITNVILYIGTVLLSLISNVMVFYIERIIYMKSSEYSEFTPGYPSYLDKHHIIVGLAIWVIGNMFIMVRAIAKIIENIIMCSRKKGQRKWYIFLIILLFAEVAINIITILCGVAYYKQEIG